MPSERERGPLDELFPGARDRRPEPSASAVHPRVLEVRDAPDVASFVVVVWPDAEDGPELRALLARVIEATLLAELSRTPTDLDDDGLRRVGSLRLVSFSAIEPAALARYGLCPMEADDSWREALAHVRGEASAVGREPPEDPALFRAAFTEPPELLMRIERGIRAVGAEAIFGATPGALARRVGASLSIDPSELDAMGAALVPDAVDVVRWVEPMLFQALCDAAGVHAARVLGVPVQWAVSEADEDGLAPPPLLRARTPARGDVHVPVGLELLRWSVMPRRAGEAVPSLSEWCADRFGAKG